MGSRQFKLNWLLKNNPILSIKRKLEAQMQKFHFYSPVKTYVHHNFAEIITDLTKYHENITIVSGKTSPDKTGFKSEIYKTLRDKNLYLFNEIEENPSINTILKGGKYLRKNKTDLVIAFGGGSAIDAAKAIALAAKNNMSFYELINKQKLSSALPVIAIPTTCGTGSEMNSYAIITDLEKKDKVNLSKESMFPKAAILEPKFLVSLKKELLISTVFDAFTHAFEGYISKRSNPFSESIALYAIDVILKTIKESDNFMNLNLEILEKFLYGSSLAGIVILHTGTTLLHALGYYLTNNLGIHHGKANAILLEKYILMCIKGNVEKIKNIHNIFEKNNMVLSKFAEPFYGKTDINRLINKKDSVKWVEYAINKPNAKFTPFEVNFDTISSILYS
jgi:alcohol dehydrogenase class IV